MKVHSIRIENSKLTQGKVYPFKILKIVSLGPDDDWFVLLDPYGYKILLPKVYYADYGFQIGSQISCRVDKVNCNGRVFLEPEHPHYREGEAYDFNISCKDSREDILGNKAYFFMVIDALNKQWMVTIQSKTLWDDPPKRIRCRLLRIKKGKLYLQHVEDKQGVNDVEVGKMYAFQIIDERTDPDSGKSFFILEHDDGHKHLLSTKHYKVYGLNVGDRIQCRIVEKAPEGYYILEPKHPCYEVGKKYQFPVDRLEEMVFTDGFRQKIMVVRDCFGLEVKVHLDDRLVLLFGEMPYIEAELRKINKSRLELHIAEEQPI